MTEPIQAVYPPAETFRDKGAQFFNKDGRRFDNQITAAATGAHFPDEGGMLVAHEGAKYPTKAWPFWEAVFMADVIKRAVINSLRFILSSPVRYLIPAFVILPSFLKRRIVRAALEQFSDFTEVLAVRSGTYRDPQYMCTMAREVYRVGMELAGGNPAGIRLVEAITHVLEFDDAYRYRVQDIMGELNLTALSANPGREVSRLLVLAASRGEVTTGEKFRLFARIVPYLFMTGDVRKATLAFFERADLEKLRLDRNDMYTCLIWGGYDFGGASFAERLTIRQQLDNPITP
jgi:hypothetical protein